VSDIVNTLKSRFTIKDLGEAKYCLGMHIIKDDNGFRLSQAAYTRDLLQKFEITDCKPASTPMANGVKLDTESSNEANSIFPYRELIGSLMYLALDTRPDIAHAISMLSQFNCNHGKKHWIAAKHMLRYLKSTINFSLCFKRTNKNLIGYVDAD